RALSFFVDGNVLVCSACSSDYRGGCFEILEAIPRREVDGGTSPAALEEVWCIERSGRAGILEGLTTQAYTLFTPLLPVTDQAFRLALSVRAPRVGTNDRPHVGTRLAHGIGGRVPAGGGLD